MDKSVRPIGINYASRATAISTLFRALAEALNTIYEDAKDNPLMAYRLMGWSEMAKFAADFMACEAHPVNVPVTNLGVDPSAMIIPQIEALVEASRVFAERAGLLGLTMDGGEQPPLEDIVNRDGVR